MEESLENSQEMISMSGERRDSNTADDWLPSTLPPGQELKDFCPKESPLEGTGDFKIPQTESWDDVAAGPSPSIFVTAATDTLANRTAPADVRDSNAFPGVCGLHNLGNTCYMNAGLQCIYNILGFSRHFFDVHYLEQEEGDDGVPADLMRLQLEVQLALLIRKYWCGHYQSLRPHLFKQVLGTVHSQLSGFRQQDCQEFLALLLGSLQDNHTAKPSPSPRQQTIVEPVNDNGASQDAVSTSHDPTDDDDAMKTSHEHSNDVTVEDAPHDPPMPDSTSSQEGTSAFNIVKEFQGSLHNQVICSVCNYVSTKVEPFLFLSLPLPHAYELQIKVTWIPLGDHVNQPYQLTRVLLTVLRNVTMATVKEELIKALQLAILPQAVILAEVNSHHIQRVLSDDLTIKAIDIDKRSLYAFELPAAVAGRTGGGGMGGTSLAEQETEKPSGEIVGACTGSSCSPAMDGDHDNSPPAKQLKSESAVEALPVPIVAEWHCCAICLDELMDQELKKHQSCGTMFCAACLQASMEHSAKEGASKCPVCSKTVNAEEDFVSMATGPIDQTNVSRLLQTNVLFRLVELDGTMKKFGHPRILYIPTPTTGQDLYGFVLKTIPTLCGLDSGAFTLHFTDSTGYHCSRCDYFVKCSGCQLSTEAPEVLLRPGDHLTISCLSSECGLADQVSMVTDHISMENVWDNELNLQDCLKAFSQIEQLASDNSWYCSRCQGNQTVSRVLSVQELPHTLIIHLKRFVYHRREAIKVDTPVQFPMELRACDIRHDDTSGDTYKLVAIVCHFGTIGCGHYTSYTYNIMFEQWHYFNDESAIEKDPSVELDAASAYLLFYQSSRDDHLILPSVDFDSCLQEEQLSSLYLQSRLPKSLDSPKIPPLPILKRSSSDGNLSGQTKKEHSSTTAALLMDTMDLAMATPSNPPSKAYHRTTSLLEDYSNYDFDYDDAIPGTRGPQVAMADSTSALKEAGPHYMV